MKAPQISSLSLNKPKIRLIRRYGYKASNDNYLRFIKAQLPKNSIGFYRDRWISDRKVLLYQEQYRKDENTSFLVANYYTRQNYIYIIPKSEV